MSKSNAKIFQEGIKDAIPIGLGYFAVAFSLGIAARNAGMNAVQGFLLSFLNNASAGEYAGITVIAANASYIEIAVVTLIANARYLLMSCAMGQRLKPGLSFGHRLLMGYDITDELCGIAIARPGDLEPFYTSGAMLTASPCWATGTACGIIAGNIMPARVVSALSVSLFGMFLAIIVPPAKKDKVIAALIILAFATSYAASCLPVVSSISEGTRTIILTVILSAGAAYFFPIHTEGGTEHDA